MLPIHFLLFFLPVVFLQQQVPVSLGNVPIADFMITQRNVQDNLGYKDVRYYNYQPYSQIRYGPNSQPRQEGYKYVYDTNQGRWRMAIEFNCKGSLAGWDNNQPRFLCDCGRFGGVSYQIGWCHPQTGDRSFNSYLP